MDKHHDRHHYGVALMVIGWIAITCGTFMWQGKWPAIAAFGLGCLLWGLTLVVLAAMKEERSEPAAVTGIKQRAHQRRLRGTLARPELFADARDRCDNAGARQRARQLILGTPNVTFGIGFCVPFAIVLRAPNELVCS